jgi:hypothetical protein
MAAPAADRLRMSWPSRSKRPVARTMSSCNGVPTIWAIKPIRTAGCAVKASCNGVVVVSRDRHRSDSLYNAASQRSYLTSLIIVDVASSQPSGLLALARIVRPSPSCSRASRCSGSGPLSKCIDVEAASTAEGRTVAIYSGLEASWHEPQWQLSPRSGHCPNCSPASPVRGFASRMHHHRIWVSGVSRTARLARQ